MFSAVFGVDLSKAVPFGAEIPNIVEQAIKYIDEKGKNRREEERGEI